MKKQSTKSKQQNIKQNQPAQKPPMNSYAKVSLTAAVIFVAGVIITLLVSLITKAVCLNSSIAATADTVFLSAASSSESFTSDGIFHKAPSIPESAKVAATVEEHGGEIAGFITRYQFRAPIQVIDQSIIDGFLAADPSKLTKTEIPVATPADSSKYTYELDYLKELAPDLSFVTVATIPGLDGIYLVADDTDKVANFLSSALSSSIHNAYTSEDTDNIDDAKTTDNSEDLEYSPNHPAQYSLIAKFPNLASLQSYLKATSQDIANATSPIGTTLDLIRDYSFFYRRFWLIAGPLSLILLCAYLVFVHKGANS